MLREHVVANDVPKFEPIETAPGEPELAIFEKLLAEARAVRCLSSGIALVAGSLPKIYRLFAECFALPVATSYRRLPLFDPLHPNYAGDLGLAPNLKLISDA